MSWWLILKALSNEDPICLCPYPFAVLVLLNILLFYYFIKQFRPRHEDFHSCVSEGHATLSKLTAVRQLYLFIFYRDIIGVLFNRAEFHRKYFAEPQT